MAIVDKISLSNDFIGELSEYWAKVAVDLSSG